jgi:hypothetical protein
MNRTQLKEMLDRAGVNESLYSLDGPAHDSESYSLVADGDLWKVLYKEHGRFEELQDSLSEEQACDLIYKLLNAALDLNSRRDITARDVN